MQKIPNKVGSSEKIIGNIEGKAQRLVNDISIKIHEQLP
jgi:hypothetical protein